MAAMRFYWKKGVRFGGAKPEIEPIFTAAIQAFGDFNCDCWCTSVTDGTHKPRSGKKSKHYDGLAADFRTRAVDVDYHERIAARMREYLTEEYQVVVEGNHIHAEFDP